MCTAHYTEGVHLICEWEADKQSCSKDREEFGWLRDVLDQKKKQKPKTSWVSAQSSVTVLQKETHSSDLISNVSQVFSHFHEPRLYNFIISFWSFKRCDSIHPSGGRMASLSCTFSDSYAILFFFYIKHILFNIFKVNTSEFKIKLQSWRTFNHKYDYCHVFLCL